MRTPLLTLLLLTCCIFTKAQTNNCTLTSIIEVTTGEVFPYKLVLTEADGKVTGFSYTYKEPNDTKAMITGTLDKKSRKLAFKETEIIYSGGFHTKAFMCLIDAHLGYVQGGMGNVLKGSITSREADNKTQCTGGTITFSKDAELQNLFSYHEQFDTVISMKRKPKPLVAAATEHKPMEEIMPVTTDQVTTGIVKTYDWHSDSLVLDLWDGGDVDGDKVTIQYNGKNQLTGYSILKQRKRIKIPVSTSGIDVLTIIADNEGTDPPNTASLLLTDGNTRYSILAYNKKGDISVIKIKRVR